MNQMMADTNVLLASLVSLSRSFFGTHERPKQYVEPHVDFVPVPKIQTSSSVVTSSMIADSDLLLTPNIDALLLTMWHY